MAAFSGNDDFFHVNDTPVHKNITENKLDHNINLPTSLWNIICGVLISLLSGVSSCTYYTFIKLLSAKGISVMILSFWVSSAGLILSLGFMLVFELDKMTFPEAGDNLLYLSLHAVLSAIEPFPKNGAIYFGSASIVAIVCTSEIPLKMLCQYHCGLA